MSCHTACKQSFYIICFQKSQPLAEDIIQLWEDYQFMNYCDQIWYQGRDEVIWSDREHCSQILSQASPSLIKILQAIRFCPSGFRLLFKIHLMFDFSWDELRTAICSLRSLVCEKERWLIREVSIDALNPTRFQVPFDSIMWDLACGSLCAMQRILGGELDNYLM
jgi:hypothetical protein